MIDKQLFRIVLTGGPCAGKTTAMSNITDRLRSLGFNVFVVPEVATMLILGGISLLDADPSVVMMKQAAMLETQLSLEKTFVKMASMSDRSTVILYDRGTMDSSAFVQPHLWQAILDSHGWTTVGLRDKHYDAVIHLVTAAIGAPEAYTLENNAARSETPELAAEIDSRIKEAWIGHPHLRVIDNSTDFAEKIRRVTAAICNVVGVPEPLERERKFLVTHVDLRHATKIVTVDIEQTYLKSEADVARVRKRGQDRSFTYTYTVKREIQPGKNVEREKMITSKDYLSYLEEADQDRVMIRKKRTCFLWKNSYYELDVFIEPFNGVCLLELESDEDNSPCEIPPWIKIDREVTDDPAYSNANIAKKVQNVQST